MWQIPKCFSDSISVKVYAELAYQTGLESDLKLITFQNSLYLLKDN